MKILSLKYKMHKLVNLVFYVIVFGLGFLLGFLGNKINFNDLFSNFLFIDKVYAEEIELVCDEGENLFDINKVVSNNSNLKIERYSGTVRLSGSSTWLSAEYDFVLEPGQYKLSAYISGDNDAIQVRKVVVNENGESTKEWVDAIYNDIDLNLNVEDTTTYALRLYNTFNNTTYKSTAYTINIRKINCVEEDKDIYVDIVNDNFYNFSKKIIGDLGEENYFVYDFITLGLISVCFIFFVLLIGYIIKKFFGG